MNALDVAMEYYPYVFHPITVLGVGILALVRHEWARQDVGRAALWHRVAAFLGAGVLALAPTAAFFAITGANPIVATQGNSWQMDALVASGMFVAAGVTWFLWRRFRWGTLVPGMMQALAAVTVPYIALSPVWNVSGHVVVALMPTLYLTLVDRRFWPTLTIPLVMVPNDSTWTLTPPPRSSVRSSSRSASSSVSTGYRPEVRYARPRVRDPLISRRSYAD